MSSDVDVAVIPQGRWNEQKPALLRAKLEDLDVPYIVALVDFSNVSKEFREIALRMVVWWQRKIL